MRVIVCKGTLSEGINNIDPWPECEKLENRNTMIELQTLLLARQ